MYWHCNISHVYLLYINNKRERDTMQYDDIDIEQVIDQLASECEMIDLE